MKLKKNSVTTHQECLRDASQSSVSSISRVTSVTTWYEMTLSTPPRQQLQIGYKLVVETFKKKKPSQYERVQAAPD